MVVRVCFGHFECPYGMYFVLCCPSRIGGGLPLSWAGSVHIYIIPIYAMVLGTVHDMCGYMYNICTQFDMRKKILLKSRSVYLPHLLGPFCSRRRVTSTASTAPRRC